MGSMKGMQCTRARHTGSSWNGTKRMTDHVSTCRKIGISGSEWTNILGLLFSWWNKLQGCGLRVRSRRRCYLLSGMRLKAAAHKRLLMKLPLIIKIEFGSSIPGPVPQPVQFPNMFASTE